MKHVVASSLSLLLAFSVSAQELIRGPYLQFPTSSSMKVMWRTQSPTPARVYYGTSVATLMDNFVDSVNPIINHTVAISGLAPYTEYYYAISDGQNVLSGGDEFHRFRTSPIIGTEQPISIWAIGDFGKGNSKQKDVMDSYVNHMGNNVSDVWLWLGDNVYDDGLDEEYQAKVFGTEYGMTDIFKRLPFMAIPGNHDYNSIAPPTASINPLLHTGAYYDIVDVPTNGEIGGVASGSELYYSFDYGNVHFIGLNSELGSILSTTNDWIGANPFGSFNGSPMTEWLHADLAANDKKWVVAFFHQPPHTGGSHSSGDFWETYMKAMRENICPILESYGVDLVVNGHSHVYERSYLLHDYFGLPDQFNAAQHVVDNGSGSLAAGTPYIKYTEGPTAGIGTVYLIQGNSGSSETDAPLDHPAMYSTVGCDSCVGSSLLYVHGDTLKGRYMASSGELMDEFAIIKRVAPSGVNEPTKPLFGEVKVYPNPFRDETMVTFNVYQEMSATIELVSLTGQIIHVFNSGTLAKGPQNYKINASELKLAKGAYLVRINSSVQPSVTRLIKVE